MERIDRDCEILQAGLGPFRSKVVAIVGAHPDDEVLGAGGQIPSMRHVSVICLTDGAPSRRTARLHGFSTRRAYARARCAELQAALARLRDAGADCDCAFLGLRDGTVSLHMGETIRRLALLLGRMQPELVLTHPYEGGHPDHDAAALITRAALAGAGLSCPLWEFASYHRGGGTLSHGAFLPSGGVGVLEVTLGPLQRAAKAAALACFRSQASVVERFDPAVERFREAPEYDFRIPPHPGRLNYEARRRAMTGPHWRAFAARASAGRAPPAIVDAARRAAWRLWLAN